MTIYKLKYLLLILRLKLLIVLFCQLTVTQKQKNKKNSLVKTKKRIKTNQEQESHRYPQHQTSTPSIIKHQHSNLTLIAPKKQADNNYVCHIDVKKILFKQQETTIVAINMIISTCNTYQLIKFKLLIVIFIFRYTIFNFGLANKKQLKKIHDKFEI